MYTITTSVEIAAPPGVVRDKVRPIPAPPNVPEQTDLVLETVPGFRSFTHLLSIWLYSTHLFCH